MTKKQEELDSVSMVLLHYGNRCAMQNGRGSETPAKDYRDAKDNIYKIINFEVLSVLDEIFEAARWETRGRDKPTYFINKKLQEIRGRYE